MGNVKIKKYFHPRDVHRTTTSHLVPKVDNFFEKNPWTLENQLRPWRSGVLSIVKGKNDNILAPGPWIKKLRTLCFSKLLKLKKRKCPYFFNYGSGGEIWPFHLLKSGSGGRTIIKERKCWYLGPWAMNLKNYAFSNFKSWRKESGLMFMIWDPGAERWPFYLLELRN